MGRVKQKKLRWEASESLDVVAYRLYWSKNGDVGYGSEHADLGEVSEIALPDDVPVFPRTAGDIQLGLSSLNRSGNESEITKINVYLDFTVPEAPTGLKVEDF